MTNGCAAFWSHHVQHQQCYIIFKLGSQCCVVTARPMAATAAAAAGAPNRPRAVLNGPGRGGRSVCRVSSTAVNRLSALAWCAEPSGTGTCSSSVQMPSANCKAEERGEPGGEHGKEKQKQQCFQGKTSSSDFLAIGMAQRLCVRYV